MLFTKSCMFGDWSNSLGKEYAESVKKLKFPLRSQHLTFYKGVP